MSRKRKEMTHISRQLLQFSLLQLKTKKRKTRMSRVDYLQRNNLIHDIHSGRVYCFYVDEYNLKLRKFQVLFVKLTLDLINLPPL